MVLDDILNARPSLRARALAAREHATAIREAELEVQAAELGADLLQWLRDELAATEAELVDVEVCSEPANAAAAARVTIDGVGLRARYDKDADSGVVFEVNRRGSSIWVKVQTLADVGKIIER